MFHLLFQFARIFPFRRLGVQDINQPWLLVIDTPTTEIAFLGINAVDAYANIGG
jgi:hypothetical protein